MPTCPSAYKRFWNTACLAVFLCGTTLPAQGEIASQHEFEAALQTWASRLEENPAFRVKASLYRRVGEMLQGSTLRTYCRSASFTCDNRGQGHIRLEYTSHWRLWQAFVSPALEPRLTARERRALAEARRLVAALPEACAAEKLLLLHDALVARADYEMQGADSAAELLLEHRGSCAAYSGALWLLLHMAGIPAVIVEGTAGGPHGWNMVQLEGKWYHVDATWNDPLVGNVSAGMVSHAWFCLSDAEMKSTHRWRKEDYPAARGDVAWHFRRKGLYFNTFSDFWEAAMKAYTKGEASFEGYLETYGNRRQFMQQLELLSGRPGFPRSLSWVGPETGAGAVYLTFSRSRNER